MPPKEAPKPKQIPSWLNFVIGGVSGMMAIVIVQPMDLLKTRMQLLGTEAKNTSVIQVAQKTLQNEGILGFYTGLSAGLFRQATYTTARLGCFNALFDVYKEHYGVPSFLAKVALGCVSGSIAAIVGTPADVSLIRMTADGRLPPEKRRNYTHVFNALSRITREEGIRALWSGTGATVSRAAVVSGSQLSAYTQVREMLAPYLAEGIPLHFVAAMTAGFVTSFCSIPFDIVKTRVQNSGGKLGQLQVFSSIIKNEGVLALWSGFLPTCAKIGPHTVFCFIFLEQLNALYFKYG